MNPSDMYRAGIPLSVSGKPYVRTVPLPLKRMAACEKCVFGSGKHTCGGTRCTAAIKAALAEGEKVNREWDRYFAAKP